MRWDLLFISATNTGMGKTYAITQLLQALCNNGAFPLCCKPIETGIRHINSKDTDYAKQFACLNELHLLQHYRQKLNNPNFLIAADELCMQKLHLAASPFVSAAAQSTKINRDSVFNFITKLHQIATPEPLLIEGAGGLFVPIHKDFFMIDIISTLKIPTVLVSNGVLGEINTICLSIEALQMRNIEYFLWINPKNHAQSNAFLTLSKPFFKKAKIPYFYKKTGIIQIAIQLLKNRHEKNTDIS